MKLRSTVIEYSLCAIIPQDEEKSIMTNPDPVQVHIPPAVQTATKSVVATITTGLGVLGLFATAIADGSLSWSEGGTLIGAVATAVATIAGVWRVPNQPVTSSAARAAGGHVPFGPGR